MSSNDLSLYEATPRQTKKFIIQILQAGLVPFIQSSPGMGKSSIIRFIAKELNLKLIDHRVSTSAPEDLTGLPNFENGFAKFFPFEDLFPVATTPIPLNSKGQPYDGWLIFLDEFNSAPKSVLAATYKLILDRMVGQLPLHQNVLIVCAGNKSTDRAITTTMPTALQSRLVHISMRIDFQEWLKDVAIPQNYDARVIGFLSRYNDKLMDFSPDHQERTFACPRTWEFVNAIMRNVTTVDDDLTTLLAGTITSGIAAEFTAYARVYENMVTLEQVIKDPLYCPVPDDTATSWAVITSLAYKASDDNFAELTEYIDRFGMSFKVLFIRMALARTPTLRKNPAYSRVAQKLAQYLA